MLVVFLLGDLRPHNGLVFADNDMGIVGLHIPFLSAFHDLALRIGRVGLEGFGIDQGLLGFSTSKGAGGLFPLDALLFGFFFFLPLKSLGLGLKVGQTLPDSAPSLVLLRQSLGKAISVFLSLSGGLGPAFSGPHLHCPVPEGA